MNDALKSYLKDMTAVAAKHGNIVAEDLSTADDTYNPSLGPCLYWDSDTQEYVFKMPDLSVLRGE